MAFDTRFTASCADWLEWQPVAGGRLKYEYRVKVFGSDMSFLFYYGYSATSSAIDLPVGNIDVGMINQVEFYILDSVDDRLLVVENVTVS